MQLTFETILWFTGPFIVMVAHMVSDVLKFALLYLEFYIPFGKCVHSSWSTVNSSAFLKRKGSQAVHKLNILLSKEQNIRWYDNKDSQKLFMTTKGYKKKNPKIQY